MKKKNLIKHLVNYDNEKTKDIYVDIDAYMYIRHLECKLTEADHRNEALRLELEAIKPVVKNVELEPAVSKHCEHCKYVVRSSWNGQPLKCRKNGVCKDFVPTES